jgi:fructoselysine 6-phosphate deglycase
MLQLNKAEVDFLVTDTMCEEVRRLLVESPPRIEEVLRGHSNPNAVYFVACGSPLSACETAVGLLQKNSGLPAFAMSAAEFAAQPPFGLSEHSLVVAVSHSGTTQEVLDAILLARQRGAYTYAITNRSSSPLAQISTSSFAYNGECIWEIHLLLTYYIALALCPETTNLHRLKEELKLLPKLLNQLLQTWEEPARRLAETASQWPGMYSISAGNCWPLAYKEGVITLMEFVWTHGCALSAAEFRHGLLEMTESTTPYLFLIGNDTSAELTRRAYRFVTQHSQRVLLFDINEILPGYHVDLTPFLLFVPLEFFFYYLSLYKNHHPDQRRYYGGLQPY